MTTLDQNTAESSPSYLKLHLKLLESRFRTVKGSLEMLTVYECPNIKSAAPVISPVLTLVNPNRSPSIDLPKVCNRWGFYPVSKRALTHAFISNRALTRDFISMVNTLKIRRNILRTLGSAVSTGAFESLILFVIQAEHPNTTRDELRLQIDYLAGRDLIKAQHCHDGRWFCELRGVAL